MTTNLNNVKTDTLKAYAMKTPPGVSRRDVVKILARRLKASPKKIRRQARTRFWLN